MNENVVTPVRRLKWPLNGILSPVTLLKGLFRQTIFLRCESPVRQVSYGSMHGN